jgi:hypothetical protein
MVCLDDALLLGLVEGTLERNEIVGVDAHIDRCRECFALVTEVMRARPTDPTSESAASPTNAGALETAEVGRRYLLLDLIVQGGMGRVYRAVDRLTGQTVALKRVLLGARSDLPPARSLDALAQEFRTLSTLRHPNINSVLDYGFDAEHRPYFTAPACSTCSARWWSARAIRC